MLSHSGWHDSRARAVKRAGARRRRCCALSGPGREAESELPGIPRLVPGISRAEVRRSFITTTVREEESQVTPQRRHR